MFFMYNDFGGIYFIEKLKFSVRKNFSINDFCSSVTAKL